MPKRGQLLQMVVIGAIASAIGVAIALVLPWFPPAASEQADRVDTVYRVLLIISVPIFVFVEVVVLFSVWKFRVRPGQELSDGPPIHGNTRIEIVWTAAPAILLVSLCAYAYVVLHKDEQAVPGTLRVDVKGQQFAWSYTYPELSKKVSNALYLPTNRSVLFHVTTSDVIHDFFVPAFRVKTDAVPGVVTSTRATATREGVYPVVCAELCGAGHSTMRSTVHVVSPGAFRAWAARELGAKQ